MFSHLTRRSSRGAGEEGGWTVPNMSEKTFVYKGKLKGSFLLTLRWGKELLCFLSDPLKTKV